MNIPKEIFHYTNAGKDIISNCLLKVTSPNKLNDPFEFLPSEYKNITHTKLAEWNDENQYRTQYEHLKNEYEDVFQEYNISNFDDFKKWCMTDKGIQKLTKEGIQNRDFRNFVNRMSEKFGVICFSSLKDNVLMWSHYANSHYGMVIGFNPLKITKKDKLLEIKYEDDRVALNFLGKNEKVNIEDVRNVTTTKATYWDYEKEWRILVELSNCQKDSNGNKFLPILENSITSVIFGLRMDNKMRQDISKIILKKFGTEIPIKEAVLDPKRFKLHFKKVKQ